MLIRRYRPQDNEAVKALHYAGLAQFGGAADPYYDSDLDDIEGIYINNNGDFLIGTDKNKIIAMGAIRKVSSIRAEIKRIRVHRNYQRQGYGETILLRLIDLARKLGYSEVCLDATVDNTPARRLFEKCGFTQTHRGKVGV